MDRERFGLIMADDTFKVLSKEEQQLILDKSIKALQIPDKFTGYNNIIVVTEELAELSQVLCKSLRGKTDRTAILEELADVAIGNDYIQKIYGITDEELEKAKSVKLKRLDTHIDENRFFTTH